VTLQLGGAGWSKINWTKTTDTHTSVHLDLVLIQTDTVVRYGSNVGANDGAS